MSTIKLKLFLDYLFRIVCPSIECERSCSTIIMQIAIDSCCATFAEVQKRGEDFWSEFELYAADLLVGLVVDVALVGLLAPYARIGKPSAAPTGLFKDLKRACASLPSR